MAFKALGTLAQVNASTMTVERPPANAGDVLLMFFNARYSNRVWTFPEGWSIVQSYDPNSSSNNEIALLYRVVAESEPLTYTINCASLTLYSAIIAVYDPSTIADSAQSLNATSTAVICPSVTGASGDTLVCYYGTRNSGTADRRYTAPDGMVERYDNKESGGLYTDFGFSDQSIVTSGVTGTRSFSFTDTGQASAGISLVLTSSGGTPPAGNVTIGTITKTSTTATVPYTYSASDQTGFEYRLNGGAAIADAASPADLTGLTASTAYTIEVRAVNASGSGAWSAVGNFTTDAAPALPPAGTVTIGTITTTQTTASVPYTYSASDQTGFQYRLNGGAATTASASPIGLTGLTAATPYTIEVRAINAAGNGSWSAVANFTTASVATGTFTTGVLRKLVGGAVLANTALTYFRLYNPTTGELVLNRTDLSTDSNGRVTCVDAAITAGTEYRADWLAVTGECRMSKKAAI